MASMLTQLAAEAAAMKVGAVADPVRLHKQATLDRRVCALRRHFNACFKHINHLPPALLSATRSAHHPNERPAAARAILQVCRNSPCAELIFVIAFCAVLQVVDGALTKLQGWCVVSGALAAKLRRLVETFAVYSDVVAAYIVHAATARRIPADFVVQLEQMLRLFHAAYLAARDVDTPLKLHTHRPDIVGRFCCVKEHQEWCMVMEQGGDE